MSKIYRGPIRQFALATELHPIFNKLYNKTNIYGCLERYGRIALQDQCDQCHMLGDSEEIKIDLPTLTPNQEVPEEFVKVSGTHGLAQPFVAEIYDGKVLKNSGICTTVDGTLLLETANSREGLIQSYYRHRQLEAAQVLLKQLRKENKKLDTDFNIAVSLIEAPYRKQRSYYSTKWIQSYLTRLHGVYYCMDALGVRPKVLIEPDPPKYKIESLQLLGFDESDIVRWNPNEELHIDRLLVPSVRRVEKRVDYDRETKGVIYKLLSPSACQWLRGKVREQIHDTGAYSSKVFISREDSTERRIVNRDELLNMIEDYGYEKYVLSELSFKEQAAIFAQANQIMSPHGGGLANIMFSSECDVIEIFGDKIKPTFYLQSQVLDLEYTGVLQEPVGNDIYVDLKELDIVLNNNKVT